MGNSGPINGISVICCCHNSERTIEATLNSLLNQQLDGSINYEIVFVDNVSSDGTVQIAEKLLHNSSTCKCKIIYEDKVGLINARLAGIREATNPIILFVDDDNILPGYYISKIWSLFEQYPDVGAVGGIAEPYIQNRKVPDWFFEQQLMFACGPQAEHSGVLTGIRQYLYGAGLAFRTDILRDTLFKRTPPILTGRTGNMLLRGDDTEMCYRCYLSGWNIYYDEDLRFLHNIDISRITWRNACCMQRQRGITSNILNIYTRLCMGTKPKSIWYLYCLCLYRWFRFLLRPFRLFKIPIVGAASTLEFNYLIGLTYSVFFMSGKYRKSRKVITDHFLPRTPMGQE
jgi:glycosyltransferase involved in cell wall biosynthesis